MNHGKKVIHKKQSYNNINNSSSNCCFLLIIIIYHHHYYYYFRKYATMAAGVFDLCYNDMPSKAYDALNVRLQEWAGHSMIDMASLSQNRTFVSHPCCQKLLTNKFMGNIKIRELTWGFMTFPVYIKVS